MNYPTMKHYEYNFISAHHFNLMLCLENDEAVFRECKATILSRKGKLLSNGTCKKHIQFYINMLGAEQKSAAEVRRFKKCIDSMYSGEEGWQRLFYELAEGFGIIQEAE
jgi:superoxide dismutase